MSISFTGIYSWYVGKVFNIPRECPCAFSSSFSLCLTMSTLWLKILEVFLWGFGESFWHINHVYESTEILLLGEQGVWKFYKDIKLCLHICLEVSFSWTTKYTFSFLFSLKHLHYFYKVHIQFCVFLEALVLLPQNTHSVLCFLGSTYRVILFIQRTH